MVPNSFIDKERAAELTAKMLLEIKAVNFRADEPYKFTSGLASPVYIDCRKIISFPRVRSSLMDFATSAILRDVGFEQIDAVAGGETAGIPFAAWISERLSLPMLYVRKKAKGFGRDAQIEGHLEDGARVILVEDLTTDGGSKVKFAEALKTAGATINHTMALFYYDIFPATHERLAAEGLKLHYLATWWDVLSIARKDGYFDEATLKEVESFLNDPLPWSGKNGGIKELAA